MNKEKLVEKIIRIFYTASPEKTEYHNFGTVDIAYFGGYRVELVRVDPVTAGRPPMCELSFSVGELKLLYYTCPKKNIIRLKKLKTND